jgi:hypothetical protein
MDERGVDRLAVKLTIFGVGVLLAACVLSGRAEILIGMFN